VDIDVKLLRGLAQDKEIPFDGIAKARVEIEFNRKDKKEEEA
jgi:hypothetical protein